LAVFHFKFNSWNDSYTIRLENTAPSHNIIWTQRISCNYYKQHLQQLYSSENQRQRITATTAGFGLLWS